MSNTEKLRTYELTLTPSYVPSWGVWEALRELHQNVLDWDMGIIDCVDDKVRFISRGCTIQSSTLLLGGGTKSEDYLPEGEMKSSRGIHGEGYKLALVALLRTGHRIEIHNGSVIWIPSFRYSDLFDTEVLVIDEFPAPDYAGDDAVEWDDLVFQVSGVSLEDYQLYQSRVRTNYGHWIDGEQNSQRLFVGGLYVCDIKGTYSYNFTPELVNLDRDRSVVRDWDFDATTAAYWLNVTKDPRKEYIDESWDHLVRQVRQVYDHDELEAQIIESLEEEGRDTSHVSYDSNRLSADIQEKIVDKWGSQLSESGHVPVTYHHEIEEMQRQGYRAKVVPSAICSVLRDSDEYEAPEPEPSPAEILEDWLETNKRHMRRSSIAAMRLLIEEKAKRWKLS